jgi:hypothetical protein
VIRTSLSNEIARSLSPLLSAVRPAASFSDNSVVSITHLPDVISSSAGASSATARAEKIIRGHNDPNDTKEAEQAHQLCVRAQDISRIFPNSRWRSLLCYTLSASEIALAKLSYRCGKK